MVASEQLVPQEHLVRMMDLESEAKNSLSSCKTPIISKGYGMRPFRTPFDDKLQVACMVAFSF